MLAYCDPFRFAFLASRKVRGGLPDRPCDACVAPSSASFCDRFPYIGPRYARETIAESCSMRVALATAIISQTRSWVSLRR